MLQIQPLEFFKQLSCVLFADADPGITNGGLQHDGRSRPGRNAHLSGHGQADAAALGVFDGVPQKIGENLPDANPVSVQQVRDRFIRAEMKSQALLFRPEAEHAAEIIEHGTEMIVCSNKVHFSGFNLGEIQDIVDNGQQAAAGAPDGFSIGHDSKSRTGVRWLCGTRRERCAVHFPQNHLIHAQDGIDRRTDFVGHLREKITFCLIGLIRGFFLQLQRRGFKTLPPFLFPHLLDAAVIVMLVLSAKEEEKRNQQEQDCADEDIDDKLLGDLGKQFILADDDDGIPLVGKRPDKHCVFLAADGNYKIPVLHFEDPVHQAEHFLVVGEQRTLFPFVPVGDDHPVLADNEAVTLSLDLQFGNDVLDLVHAHVQRDHILTVGEHPADRNDHVSGLRVHIRRGDGELSLRIDGIPIPVPLQRIIVYGRDPGETIEIFPPDVPIDADIVPIELFFLDVRFLCQELQDPVGG